MFLSRALAASFPGEFCSKNNHIRTISISKAYSYPLRRGGGDRVKGGGRAEFKAKTRSFVVDSLKTEKVVYRSYGKAANGL